MTAAEQITRMDQGGMSDVESFVRDLLAGDLSKLLPAAILLGVILSICVALIRMLLIGAGGGSAEAARIAAIVVGFLVIFATLNSSIEPAWLSTLKWSAFAIVLVEIPKSLRELGQQGPAVRIGVVYLLAYSML